MTDHAMSSAETAPNGLRRALVLLGGGLLAGLLVILVLETVRFMGLRRENAASRAASATLAQLREDNAEVHRLRAAAQQAERAQKEQEEVARLRAEVERLRTVARELPALRAESQRLAAERVSAAANADATKEEDPFAKEKRRAQRTACVSNLKQVCLAAIVWAHDRAKSGQPLIMPADFQSTRNELSTPELLTCPGDTARKPVTSWDQFNAGNVSYELLSPGPVLDSDFDVVLARCPIHNNAGMLDGSVIAVDAATHRIEKVNGKFKVRRVATPMPTSP